jgi:hypothetical protein
VTRSSAVTAFALAALLGFYLWLVGLLRLFDIIFYLFGIE